MKTPAPIDWEGASFETLDGTTGTIKQCVDTGRGEYKALLEVTSPEGVKRPVFVSFVLYLRSSAAPPLDAAPEA